jgi:hypothetical protein
MRAKMGGSGRGRTSRSERLEVARARLWHDEKAGQTYKVEAFADYSEGESITFTVAAIYFDLCAVRYMARRAG